MNDPFDALSKNRHVEGDQEAKTEPGGRQVGDDLSYVNRTNDFDGLELDDEAFIHEQVETFFSDQFSLVGDSNRHLLSEGSRLLAAAAHIVGELDEVLEGQQSFLDGATTAMCPA